MARTTIAMEIVAQVRALPQPRGRHPDTDVFAFGSLGTVAALYATPWPLFRADRRTDGGIYVEDAWPWEPELDLRHREHRGPFVPNFQLPHDKRRRQLLIAAACIIAEIERIDRAQLIKSSPLDQKQETLP